MKLLDLLNQSNYHFFYLNVDPFLSLDLPELINLHQITPQSIGISQNISNSGQLLGHPQTQSFIKNTVSKTDKKPVIIPFKPSAKIEKICKNLGWILVANSAKTNRLLEDKIKFPQICLNHNLPVVDFIIKPLSAQSFAEAQEKFGPKLVIQTHFGWAGKSTFTASTYQQILSFITPGTLVKYSPLLSGYTLLNNCCLTKSGLLQSPPALQFTGLPQLTDNPFSTVGRQWPSLAPQTVIDKISQITNQFSEILKQYNYLGFFGLDFLVSNNQVFLLECNPRLTASFNFYTKIEMNAGFNPLFLFHLTEFINLPYQIDFAAESSRFNNPQIVGSEITQKNQQGTTIAKYSDFTIFSKNLNPDSISDSILEQLSHATT